MDKRTMMILRVVSVFCMLMAIGAIQTSVISAIFMAIASVFILPGMQMAFRQKGSAKAGLLIPVVLIVLALSISNAEITGEDPDVASTDGISISDFFGG